jgi:hydrogenase expression/formation protein HypD
VSYRDEFSQSETTRKLAAKIRAAATKSWRIMEICGTHTQTILEYGIDKLLPENVEIIHGPGCAICITPLEVIDRAFAIAHLPEVIFCLFGGLLRVPGTNSDLLDAKATGADVRVVYSAMDCLKIAQENPDRKVVFFAVGSEKVLPENAQSLLEAERLGLKNYFMLSSQAHMAPICAAVMQRHIGKVNGILGPGDGCSVTGFTEYEKISRDFNVPIVVSGVEPIDVLEGLYKCVVQLESGKHVVENQYTKFVTRQGNPEHHNSINATFMPCDYRWRRLGIIPDSGFQLKQKYDSFNAWLAFDVVEKPSRESPICISEEIMLGLKKPWDCPAFGKSCTPQHPIGATMVSSEGTCALYHKYRTKEEQQEVQPSVL